MPKYIYKLEGKNILGKMIFHSMISLPTDCPIDFMLDNYIQERGMNIAVSTVFIEKLSFSIDRPDTQKETKEYYTEYNGDHKLWYVAEIDLINPLTFRAISGILLSS